MKFYRTILTIASVIIGAGVVLFAVSALRQHQETSGNRGGGGPSAGMTAKIPVRTVVMKAGDFERRQVFNGSIRSREFIEITSEVSGRVGALHFEDGDTVEAGALLVSLDDREPQAQARAIAEELNLARLNAERLEVLWQSQGIPQRDLDEARSRRNVLAAQLENLQARLEKYRIYAPFSGKLGFREVSMGASLQPGMRITTLQSIDPILIDFPVAERYRTHFEPGVPVSATVSGMEDAFDGEVFRVDPRTDPSTRTVAVRAVFPNPHGKLQPGGFARVRVHLNTAGSIVVPATAVVRGLLDVAVFVANNGVAERRIVELGERTADAVEILSGLSDGDVLIVEGTQRVRPGVALDVQHQGGQTSTNEAP